jgi:hypothetical protein
VALPVHLSARTVAKEESRMPKQRPRPRSRRTFYALAGATALAMVVTLGLALRAETPPGIRGDVAARGSAPAAVAQWVRRETRPTLDPARFTGMASTAYQVAREMPDVLDQLQCYCACRYEYGHVSLLSCYADSHGST